MSGRGQQSDNLALYVHWPFCVTKCPYCDFNSHVRPDADHERYGAALVRELEHEASLTSGQKLASIFFGGGTPSLMPPEIVGRIVEAAHKLWPVSDNLEITLEANPSSVEAGRFQAFAAAGVNRVSLGVQALDDAALRLLGRPHDLAEGLAAIALAQENFPRVSFDLIHTRPGQTPDAWAAELRRALSFGTGHLSAYQLTIEPGTRFYTLARKGLITLPDEEASADMFEMTAEICEEAGLPAYEISNHARPGEESRHNLTYWTYAPYIGIGPGAHGRRKGKHGPLATERARRPETWLQLVEETGTALTQETTIGRGAAAREALMMGLRLTEGIDPETFYRHTGVRLADAIDGNARQQLEELGLLAPGARLRATSAGRGLTNRLIVKLALDDLHDDLHLETSQETPDLSDDVEA